MISLKQVIEQIKDFADAHEVVQKFGYEFKEQMQNLATVDEKYPYFFVTPIGAMALENVVEFELDVYCVDRTQKDRTNLGLIVSDTQLVLTDFTVWLEDGDHSIEVERIYPMTPINNDLLDYVAGWVVRVKVQVERVALCEVPINPIEPNFPIVCEDAIQIIEDTLGNRLYTNSIPSGTTETQVIQDSTAILKDTIGTFISSTSIIAEGSEAIIAPNAKLHIKKENDGTITNLTLLSNSNTQYIIDNNDISVNGVLEFDIHATEALDIRLRDASNNVITPISVTDSGNHATIVLPTASGPVGATLMKTGQTTSYRTGDDGDIEAGRAVDFLTLASANPFGNTNRFTDELGGSTYTNNWVIDWSTYNGTNVLGYFRTVQAAANWNTAIDNSLGTFGTFAGCRLWNINELFNLINVELLIPINYAPFNWSVNYQFWSSNKRKSATNAPWNMQYRTDWSISAGTDQGASYSYIPVRTFTVTGTTLT